MSSKIKSLHQNKRDQIRRMNALTLREACKLYSSFFLSSTCCSSLFGGSRFFPCFFEFSYYFNVFLVPDGPRPPFPLYPHRVSERYKKERKSHQLLQLKTAGNQPPAYHSKLAQCKRATVQIMREAKAETNKHAEEDNKVFSPCTHVDIADFDSVAEEAAAFFFSLA